MARKTVAGTPADPTTGFVDLELDGKAFKLAFDFDAVAEAEDKAGVSLLIGVDWRNLRVRQLRGLLYAAALKAQPDTKIEDLTKYIIPRYTTAIVNSLVEAWIAATPDRDTDENPPTPAA